MNLSTSSNFRRCIWTGALLAFLIAGISAASGQSTTVANTKHNLSASGPGAIKATKESDVCIFCHSVHGAAPKTPLWNRNSFGVTYTPYASSTTKATIGQPTGSSKLCLSCHDGTVALGNVRSAKGKPIPMKNGVTMMPAGSANLGTDLSGDHPVSFRFDPALASANNGLKNPALLGKHVRLDSDQQMQCTSCHDPHNDQFGDFLVQNNTGSALCLTCHSLNNWASSSHSTSSAVWNGQGVNPWPHSTAKTVAANACENCHATHAAGTKPRLLTFAGGDEGCYVCHSGNVAKKNIRAELNKMSVHPIDLTGRLHDEAEDAANAPRHVTCSDCHNPHASKSAPAAAPAVSGTLAGTKGVNAAGSAIQSVTREYELCFRCHSDSRSRTPASVARQAPETNKRLQFAPGNGSFHPVEAAGKNPNVPSLITPYNTASVIYCTDCHNSDQGPGAGGAGPKGPHGSAYAPLLERQQVLTDFTPESAASYALCYKCHSRASILSNQSFPGHRQHVVEYQTACTTCHDSHGVAGNKGLINFNTAFVTPAPKGGLSFIATGVNRGNCTLSCHGSTHQNRNYDAPIMAAKRPARH